MLNIRPSKYCQCAKYQALSVMPTHQISGPSNHANALNIRPTESCQCAEYQALSIMPTHQISGPSKHANALNIRPTESCQCAEDQALRIVPGPWSRAKVSSGHFLASNSLKISSTSSVEVQKLKKNSRQRVKQKVSICTEAQQLRSNYSVSFLLTQILLNFFLSS